MFSLKWISGFLIGSFPLVGVLFFSTAVGPQNKTIRLSIATGGTGGVFGVVGGGDQILLGEKGLAVRSRPKINNFSEHSSPAVSLREIKDHREKRFRFHH